MSFQALNDDSFEINDENHNVSQTGERQERPSPVQSAVHPRMPPWS